MLEFSIGIANDLTNEMFSAWVTSWFPATPNFAKLHLFKNDFVPTRASVLADFTEADFDGYAAVDLPVASSFPAIQLDALGNLTQVIPGTYTFTGDDPQTAAQSVYGYYVTDQAGAVLVGFHRFLDPVDFTSASMQLVLELAFRLAAEFGRSGADVESGIIFP